MLCTLLLVGSIISIAVAGASIVSAMIVAVSLVGLVGPAVAAGENFLDMVVGVFELIIESVQMLFEAVVDTISSIFG